VKRPHMHKNIGARHASLKRSDLECRPPGAEGLSKRAKKL
jgi:hypothetical protein